MAVSNSTDRFNGVLASLAVKVPAVRALSSNRADLSGAITVDGHVFQDGERLLLLGQTDPIENGVWDVNTSSEWRRSADFDGNRDATDNTIIVADRSTGGPLMYVVVGTAPIIIGTDPITFELFFDPAASDFVDIEAETIIAGDPGTEGGGITVHGVTYDSALKVSDLGGVNLAQSILHRHSTTIGPVIIAGRSNSNDASHALVTDGQALLWLIGAGWDGTDYEQGGSIQIDVDGTAGNDDMPGRIVFSTTPPGQFAPVEALRLDSLQDAYFASDVIIAGGYQTDFGRYNANNSAGPAFLINFWDADIINQWQVQMSSTATGSRLQFVDVGDAIFMEFNAIYGMGIMGGQQLRIHGDNETDYASLQLTATTAALGRLTIGGVGNVDKIEVSGATLYFNATSGANEDITNRGQVWSLTGTPVSLQFTDDLGEDFPVAGSGVAIRVGQVGLQDGVGTSRIVWSNTAGDDSIEAVINGDQLEIQQQTGLINTIRFGDGAPYYLTLDLNTGSYISQAAGGSFPGRADHVETPAAGLGQLWIRDDDPNPDTLMYTDDAGTDFEVAGDGVSGGGFSFDTFSFTFDTTTAAADPGAGFMRFNNATIGSVTRAMFSYTDGNGVDLANRFAAFGFGTRIRIEKVGDPTVWSTWAINTPTDQTTWNHPYVNLIDSSGAVPANNDVLHVALEQETNLKLPTINRAICVSSAILSAQPECGFEEWSELRVSGSPNASTLEFWDEGGHRWDISVNNGTMTMDAIDATGTSFVVRSDTWTFQAESSGLPNVIMGPNSMQLSHQNTTDAMVMYIHERTAARGNITDYGQLWVNSTGNALMYTDELGNDTNLIDVGASAQSITAGWSTGSGGSITLAANAPILYTEQADHDTIGAGQAQVWVKSDTPNTLWFTDDAGGDFQLAGIGNRTIDGQLRINRTAEQLRVYDDVGATDANDYGALSLDADLYGMTSWDDSATALRAAISISVLTGQVNLGNTAAIISANNDIDMNDNLVDTPRLKDYSIESDAPTVSTNAVTLTYSNGPAFEVDMEPATGTVTITISGGPPSGTYGQITVKVQQDGATAQTITWAGGTFRWAGGSAHPMTTTLDGFSIFTFETWDGGTTWHGAGADFS